MSNKKPSGGGDFAIAVLILTILGFLFGWLIRFILRLWNLVDPYTPRSLYDPRQVNSTRRYWMVWIAGVSIVLVLVLPPLFNGRAFAPTVSNTLALFFSVVAFGSGFLFQPKSQITPNPQQLDEALRYHRQELTQARTYRIYPTKKQADYTNTQKMMGRLLASMPRLYFRIVGTPEAIYWEIIDPTGNYYPKTIIDPVRGILGAETAIEERVGLDPEIPARLPFYRDQLYFRLANEYVAPLYFPDQLKTYDPLTAIVADMGFLEPQHDERMTYTLYVFVEAEEARHRGARRFRYGLVHSQSLLHVYDREAKTSGLSEAFVGTKLNHNLYHAMLVVTVESKDRNRLQQLSQIAASVAQYGTQGHNHLEPYTGLLVSSFVPDRRIETLANHFDTLAEEMVLKWIALADSWRDVLLVLSPLELATLWHVPNETFTTRSIAWAGVGIPSEVMTLKPDSLKLGLAVAPGRRQPVYLAAKDRAYHHYIVGRTGMGKSTYMLNWILSDIEAGHGVAVVDPHGKLTRQILASLPCREEDVLLLDCSTTEKKPIPDFPPPLNPLRVPNGTNRTAVVERLKWALEQIYHIAQFPQLSMAFGYLIETLTADPEATPLDFARFFNDPTYHEYVLSLAENIPEMPRAALDYWRNTFAGESKTERNKISRPIITRTGKFLGNQALEFITCHPNTLDYMKLVKDKRIVILNLEGDAMKNEGASVTTLFVAGLAGACESLRELPDGHPPRMYLYIDEVERVMSSTYVELLAQIRKYGLSLVLINQYLKQLPAETISGITGTVGTFVSFAIGSTDAKTFAPYFEPEVTREQIVKLDAFNVAVKTSADGKTLPSFLVSCPAIPTANPETDLQIGQTTYASDGIVPEAEVKMWLEKRYPKGERKEATSPRQPPPKRRSRPASKYEQTEEGE